jgi:tetratricopeptide (TPR) repeat protein
MKRTALVALAAATALVATTSVASACAMRKRPVVAVVAHNQLQQAEAAEARGELRTAIRLYERAMNAAGPAADRSKAALRAGLLHAKAGKATRAKARFARAAELAPDGVALRAVAAVQRGVGDLDGARGALTRALSLDGVKAADVHAELAVLEVEAGDRAAAERHLTRARTGGASAEAVVAAERALGGQQNVANADVATLRL